MVHWSETEFFRYFVLVKVVNQTPAKKKAVIQIPLKALLTWKS